MNSNTHPTDRPANRPDRPVYLDYQATTPVDPRVLDIMLPYFTEKFANPHSSSHGLGREVAAAVEHARGQVAALIGAALRAIVFTSGAPEHTTPASQGPAPFLRPRSTRAVT